MAQSFILLSMENVFNRKSYQRTLRQHEKQGRLVPQFCIDLIEKIYICFSHLPNSSLNKVGLLLFAGTLAEALAA